MSPAKDLRLASLLRWPGTTLGRTVLLFGLIFGLTWILRLVFGSSGLRFDILQIVLGAVFLGLAIPLLVRFVRHRMLWSLRSKLIVTYLLIGLAPVVLVVTLVMISAYVAAGQFSIHLVETRMQAELSQMGSENAAMTVRLAHLLNTGTNGRPEDFTAAEQSAASAVRGDQPRPRMETFVNGAPFSLQRRPPHDEDLPLGLPSWAVNPKKGGFRSIALDSGGLYLVAVQQERLLYGREFTLLSSIPVTTSLVETFVDGLGHAQLFTQQEGREAPNSDPNRNRRGGQLRFHAISAGNDPPPINLADIHVQFLSTLTATDWDTGTPISLPLEVESRPSLLYLQLFGSSLRGVITSAIRVGLIVLCVLFAVIEALALTMAIRLSRTVTASVADLYDATLRIDRGELHHQIAVSRTDQMAELSRSFNRMTVSLQRLLGEQKEKERMQNELAIAQEVQATLFPPAVHSLPTLELHGICRPARSVSGDYYDFLLFYQDNDRSASEKVATGVGIALGDISGKGISAALLMATLHSAVRLVYSATETSTRGRVLQPDGTESDLGLLFTNPGRIMSMLNRHLYRSTQPEKYATLFLAHYDVATQALTYSNAGHLPSLLLGRDGSVRRLDVGGTVVGLLDGMHYEEGRFQMRSGDILVAYSDGVTEPENEFGEFGEERLIEEVQRYRDQPLHVISSRVMQALDAWIGSEERPDDITLVLARQV